MVVLEPDPSCGGGSGSETRIVAPPPVNRLLMKTNILLSLFAFALLDGVDAVRPPQPLTDSESLPAFRLLYEWCRDNIVITIYHIFHIIPQY